ncbi:MAG: DNA primase [Cellvibrionaceae bacterium]|nr:DNA primase [Cellvibrionaceae bacterium]
MSRIPQHFIDDLLNRIDIVEVVDSRVKLRKTGKNYSACCPFHKEKTPSFTVSPDKQFYYCFGCGASGTALSFLMEYEHLGFVEAIENLAGSAGLSVPREELSAAPQKSQQNLYSILARAKTYYEQQLAEHPQRRDAVTYLKNRGLTGAVAREFGLGYAPPGWDNLLVKLGLNEEDRQLLAESGMAITNEESGRLYDRFRHRIMFPILDLRGRVIGFGGRILNSDKEPQAAGGKPRGAGPKYLNSPETAVFHKGRELYGLYQALQQQRRPENLLVVEGYMDVIALAQFGIHNAVATLGTACGEEHLKLAFRHTSSIVFCFDGDNAGRKAAKRALENALPVMTDGRKIQFLFLPEGQDPDSLVRQIGPERFSQQLNLALPLEDFFFMAVAETIDTRTMEGRAHMSKLAAPLLNRLPSGVFRELMFAQLAQRTGLSLDVLMELIHEPASLAENPQPSEIRQPNPSPSSSYIKAERLPPRPPEASRAEPPRQPQTSQLPRDTAGRIKLSPARLALTILLETPEFLHRNEVNCDLPDDATNSELTQLKTLIHLLRDRPGASFHSILGYWGGIYGMEAQKQLTSLVANHFLDEARRRSAYDSLQELKDALARIRQEEQLRRQAEELAELNRLQLHELDDTQKQRLRELLTLKQQTRLSKQ